MSIEKRVTFNDAGDPHVVIILDGYSDVIRFTEQMLGWQCEFGDCARRIRLSITKRLGADKARQYVDHFLGRRPPVGASAP